jgi:predicted nuclease of predicted toxin-antitoxin system
MDAMAILFHLDENVHLVLAEALRRRGINVSTASDAGLIGASDEEHLEFARRQGRIVVTHDADFLRIHARGVQHAGIVFCHVRKYSLRQLVRVVARFVLSTKPEDMTNRVEYL